MGVPEARGLAFLALGLAAACARPIPRAHTVELRGFAYLPATLEVAVGDTVVWINRDVVPHTATGAEGGWDSGDLAVGQSWRLVAGQQGSQPYSCTFHPTMRGMLVVR